MQKDYCDYSASKLDKASHHILTLIAMSSFSSWKERADSQLRETSKMQSEGASSEFPLGLRVDGIAGPRDWSCRLC